MADTAISGLAAAAAALRAMEIAVNDGGTTKKLTVGQLIDLFGTKGISLASDASSNSTTTAAKISGLDLADDGAGNYTFQYFILYQAGATTTGVKFSVNHTGTLTGFAVNMTYIDTTATASTAAASQAANGAAATVVGGFSARAKSTAAGMGPTISVDAANSDMLMILEGVAVVSVSGTFELYHASEVAAASTVKKGSSLTIQKMP